MLMGHSIEGRFPFLDFRVAEFAARVPDGLRLRGLREKFLLRKAAERHLPPTIAGRPKVPYRAPIHDVLFGAAAPIPRRLEPRAVRSRACSPRPPSRVVASSRHGGRRRNRRDGARGLVTLMLLHEQFVASPRLAPPLVPDRDRRRRQRHADGRSRGGR